MTIGCQIPGNLAQCCQKSGSLPCKDLGPMVPDFWHRGGSKIGDKVPI